MIMQEQIETTDANAATEAARRVLLICTVGGSPQPIASALRILRPDVVWFLVSDGNSGESSLSQVEEAEIDYDKNGAIRGPGLKFAEGCPGSAKALPIPADDPDGAYKSCRLLLAEVRRTYPNHQLVADYTGGTKSMSAALLMAALAQPGIEVQFMAGERADLVRVKSGSERPQRMAADFIMAERDFAAAEQAVAGYDYAAAQRLLDDLHQRLRGGAATLPVSFCDRVESARAWTGIMANWDAFRHVRAGEFARRERKRAQRNSNSLGLPPVQAEMARRAQNRAAWLAHSLSFSGHLAPLFALGQRPHGAPGWDLCADLWFNALRRGERGRYDDAVARLYRLVEAAAQAWLSTKYPGLSSSSIPWTQIPDSMRGRIQPSHDSHEENTKLALNALVEFLRCRDPEDRFAAAYAGGGITTEGFRGPPWLSGRNLSILAHGFTSVGENVWIEAKTWIEVNVRSFFAEAEFPQLPRAIPPP
jgi:CRISPR-associated protein (TIGR02710 family)